MNDGSFRARRTRPARGAAGLPCLFDLPDLDEDDARRTLQRELRAARTGCRQRPVTSPTFPGSSGPAVVGPVVAALDERPAFPGVTSAAALLDRVADATASRHPAAMIRPVTTGTPLPHLDEPTLVTFRDEIHREYEEIDTYAESVLVCAVTPVAEDLVRMGRRGGVAVHSLAEYEGRWDPSGYLDRQAARIERDPRYPAELYVAQRYVELDGPGVRHGGGTDPAEPASAGGEDLCASMIDWLDAGAARFLFVLGDFGHGKSFVLRELTRRLPAELPKAVPSVIVRCPT